MAKAKKKVLFTINSLRRNGPNVVLANMIEGLSSEDVEIWIVSLLAGDDVAYVEGLLGQYRQVHYENLGLTGLPQIITSGVVKLKPLLEKVQPDVIHSHGLFPDYVSSKLRGFRLVTTVHNAPFEDYINRWGKIKGFLVAKWHMLLLRRFHVVVACSKASFDNIQNHLHVTPKTIHNAIGGKSHWTKALYRERIAVREQLGLKASDTVYIFNGSLVEGKNIRFLLESFASARTTEEKLIIVGDGPERAFAEKFAGETVKIVGFQEDPLPYLAASDVYISASKSEGFSISILEAIKYGLYLFLSDIPSHREVIELSGEKKLGSVFAFGAFHESILDFRKETMPFDKKAMIMFGNKHFTAELMMKSYLVFYWENKNEI